MTLGQFVGATIGVQLVVLALDLADRHATRKSRYGGEPLEPAAFAFLVAVIVVFLAAVVITNIFIGWWPDQLVVPALQLGAGVAVIAALSLGGSVVLVLNN